MLLHVCCDAQTHACWLMQLQLFCPGTTRATACPLLVPLQKGHCMIYAPVLWVRWELFVLWGTSLIKMWNMKLNFVHELIYKVEQILSRPAGTGLINTWVGLAACWIIAVYPVHFNLYQRANCNNIYSHTFLWHWIHDISALFLQDKHSKSSLFTWFVYLRLTSVQTRQLPVSHTCILNQSTSQGTQGGFWLPNALGWPRMTGL